MQDVRSMKIMISGTPGTGKTETASELSRLMDLRLVKVNDLAQSEGIIEGEDRSRGSLIVDDSRLSRIVSSIEDDIVLEGHMAHLCKGDLAVVLRTSPDVLEKRLSSRGWGVSKIRENLEAEVLDVITQEAVDVNQTVIELDTTCSTPEKTASMIKEIMSRKRYDAYGPGTVSWVSEIEKYIS